MATIRCGVLDEDGNPCVLTGMHMDHFASGRTWPNEDARAARARSPKPLGKDQRKTTLRQMASRAAPASRVNPVQDGQGAFSPSRAWGPSEWTTHASQVLHGVLMTRSEPFTTPEVLWPLLDSPPTDMRALSVVVQQALREGKMIEVGFIRLRGTYRTRDGVTFKMNKATSRYRSLISPL